MHCACPHYREPPNGWRCTECLRLEGEVAALNEALRREKDRNRHQDRTGTEAEFGASAPSSRRVKANSPEENRLRRGGARKGHAPHVRRGASDESADEVRPVDAPGTCPCCGGPLEPMGERRRTVDDLERPRPRRVLYRLERKWCPACGRAVQARAPGVLPRAGLTNRAPPKPSTPTWAPWARPRAWPVSARDGCWARWRPWRAGWKGACRACARRCAPQRSPTPTKRPGAATAATATPGVSTPPTPPSTPTGRPDPPPSPGEVFEGIRPGATVVTDRYAGYHWLTACHRQFCFEHLKRDALDIARQFPDSPECRASANTSPGCCAGSCACGGKRPAPDDYRPKAFLLAAELEECMAAEARHPAIQAFQNIFRENRAACMRWTAGPDIPADNNAAERAMRPLAVVRKISGGSQSEGGLRTREVLASVWATLRQRHGQPKARDLFVAALNTLDDNPATDLPNLLFPSPTSGPAVNP